MNFPSKKKVRRIVSHLISFQLLFSIYLFMSASTVSAQHIEDGQLVFPERRITAFVYHGADENILRTTGSKITTMEGDAPGSWLYEWATIGEYFEGIGDNLLSQGKSNEARGEYVRAAVYYSVAWFPSTRTPEGQVGFAKQLNVYQKAGALFDVPLEVVNVPFRGDSLVTYLHRPPGIENPPVVIWSGGGDQYKANYYRPIQELHAKGLAVLTFDLPGFGESDRWSVEPTSDEAHIAILEHLIDREDIDAERIAFLGISFGGYFANRVAARNDPRISAVVSFCGLVHELFAKPVEVFSAMLDSPEKATMVSAAAALGVEATGEAVQAAFAPFSLLEAGILQPGKTITTPLLVLNGTRDPFTSVADFSLVHNAAVESDLWLLGSAGHCAMEYWPVVIPQLADWLVDKLSD